MPISKKPLIALSLLLSAAVLAGPLAPALTWANSPPPIVYPANQAPAAAKYLGFIETVMAQVRNDIPQISKSADAAATLYIAGKDLGVRGGMGLNEELGARAGGICLYRCTPGKPGDTILYAFGVTSSKDAANPKAALEKEIADAKKLKDAGSLVYGVASIEHLKSLGLLDAAKAATTDIFDNHCPAGDGFVKSADGKQVIPTFTTANAVVSWVWMAEFFAACTRQGKTLAMYQSIVNDKDRTRYDKYKAVRFHDDMTVAPIPAGQLGNAYLDSLIGSFNNIKSKAWPSLTQASDKIAKTLKSGNKVHLFATGHYPPYHSEGQLAADPKIFTTVRPDTQKKDKKNPDAPPTIVPGTPDPSPADISLAIGYSLPPGPDNQMFWRSGDEKLRKAGQGVIWVISSVRTKPGDLKPNEILVDQSWADGDAAIPVKGYDVKICPPSGVLAEALMWAITAQALADTSK
jgi:uncharacterized phosphosugar-binding protein